MSEKLPTLPDSSLADMVKKMMNDRKTSYAGIERQVESLSKTLSDAREKLGQEPLCLIKNSDKEVVLSLEDVLRNVSTTLGLALTHMQTSDQFIDLILHDLAFAIRGQHELRNGLMTIGVNSTATIQALVNKGVLDEADLEAAWNKLQEEESETKE